MAKWLGSTISKSDILRHVGNIKQVVKIEETKINSGKGKDITKYDINTGSGLTFSVLKDKCLDIFEMQYKGIPLNYVAKPSVTNCQVPYYLDFSEYFQGGLLYTCGLTNVGAPCTEYDVDYNTHGKIGCIPAENSYGIGYWEGDDYIIQLQGEMREASLFGENLVLKRTIKTKFGSSVIKITNQVENQGFTEVPLMLLLHVNFGYPFISEHAELVLPTTSVMPRDKPSEKGLSKWETLTPAIDGMNEEVFYHQLECDDNNQTCIAVVNNKLNIALYMKYNLNDLPRITNWKMMGSGDYVLALEPANCHVGGRVKERENKTLQTIMPLETRNFDIEIGVLEGEEEIERLKQSIYFILHK